MGLAQCVAPRLSLTSTCFCGHRPRVYTFPIPACIPSADYLLRIQSLSIHNPGSTPQWYISCAQLTVTGGGSKDLGPKVAIPGVFKATDPGYTANIYNSVSICLDIPNIVLAKRIVSLQATPSLDYQSLPVRFSKPIVSSQGAEKHVQKGSELLPSSWNCNCL
jgi:hypothetical protein